MKKMLSLVAFIAFGLALSVQSASDEPANATGSSPATVQAAASAAAPQAAPADTAKSKLLVLTLEELKQYNGQNGKPAYIAINRDIYDVTDVAAWKGGKHHGVVAGTDGTEKLMKVSPHKTSVLKKLKVVGKLVVSGN
jgi:predicted heme/steroid binding protein